ncbi:MAG: hypothetical protein QM723_31825 [Myxococcaceae bacterium]
MLVALESAAPVVVPAHREAAPQREVAVVSVSRRGSGAAGFVTSQVVKSLRTRGLKVLEARDAQLRIMEKSGVDPASCDGTKVCVRHLAQLLGPKAVVVGVDVAKAGNVYATHLEALAADDGNPLASFDFNADARTFQGRFPLAATRFGADVAAAVNRLDVPGPDRVIALSRPAAPVTVPAEPEPLEPAKPVVLKASAVEPLPAPPPPPAPAPAAPPPPVAPAPAAPPAETAEAKEALNARIFEAWPGTAVDPEPPLTEAPPTLSAHTGRKVAKWSLLGATVVTSVTAVAFCIAGLQQRDTYNGMLKDYGGGRLNASDAPRSVLEQHASAANTDFIAALIALVATVPLAIGTGWLFATEPK